MKLGSDWEKVLRHAWSIRLIAIAVAMSIIEGIISLMGESYDLPFWLHASIIIATPLIGFAAGLSRLIAQKVFTEDMK